MGGVINPNNYPSMNNFGNLGSMVNLLNGLLIAGAGLILLPMLIYGAFVYLTGGGNPDSIKKSQGIFFTSFIGLLIVVLAFFVVNLVYTLLGSPTGAESSNINPFITK